MIDHISLIVSDYQKSKSFYLAALKPLKAELVMEYGEAAGIGIGGKPDFWIAPGKAGEGTHIAFKAETREMVDQFYQAALAAGGKDNGPPGIREIYHPNYYGAFVLDPDGNNIEAVCHR